MPEPEVPVIEHFYSDGLYTFLRSDPVQQLMAGRVDLVEIKRVKSYVGQASIRGGVRRIQMSMLPDLDESELAFILCHELAHHVAGVTERHSERWRRECVTLVAEAGELGLLSDARVEQATQMVLHGAASKFRGWPEEARKRRQEREDRREAEREAAVAKGVEPGALVFFRYRGSLWRGEVIRVNQTTVSVGEIGGDRTVLRVPFARLLDVKPNES